MRVHRVTVRFDIKTEETRAKAWELIRAELESALEIPVDIVMMSQDDKLEKCPEDEREDLLRDASFVGEA